VNHLVLELASIEIEVYEVELSQRERNIQNRLLGYITQSENENSLFGKYRIRRQSKAVKPYGYIHDEEVRSMEEYYDRIFSARILNPQVPLPDTDNRLLRKPSSTWEKLEKKKAHKAWRSGVPHVPMVSLVKTSVIKAKLEEIKASVTAKRLGRIETVARETARIEALRIEHFNLDPYSREEAAGDFWDSVYDATNSRIKAIDEFKNVSSSSKQELSAHDPSTETDISNSEIFLGSWNHFFDDTSDNESENAEPEYAEPKSYSARQLPTFKYDTLVTDELNNFWQSCNELLEEEAPLRSRG